MQKLIKRRMRSYLHPTGIHVRAYHDERSPFPPGPPQPVSAPADGTRYYDPTPPLRIDQTHIDAMVQVAVDIGKGAIKGAATGAAVAGPVGMEKGALLGAGIAATESIWSNCVNCHRKKN